MDLRACLQLYSTSSVSPEGEKHFFALAQVASIQQARILQMKRLVTGVTYIGKASRRKSCRHALKIECVTLVFHRHPR